MNRLSSISARLNNLKHDYYSQINSCSEEILSDLLDNDSYTTNNSLTRTVYMPISLVGERLDKALAQLFPEFSRSRLQSWIKMKRVLVDGLPVKVCKRVLLGEKIKLVPGLLPEQLAFIPEPIPLNVVYEDDAIIVINKPVGLVMHPAAGNWSKTILNGLLYRYGDKTTKLYRAGIVHRLDKETSGLVVVARKSIVQNELIRQLQTRTMKRSYFALVFGTIPEYGTIDAPIGRDPRERTRMAVVSSHYSKPARTHFRRVATCLWNSCSISAIQCDLETGRTHQIRVHCASVGHPLLGDKTYGHACDRHLIRPLPGGFSRQALHAWRLGFIHPTMREPVQWQCSFPEDMTTLIKELGLWRENIINLDNRS